MTSAPSIALPPPPRHGLIRLTPLIDVIFILLIFFMLASTLGPRQQLAVGVAPAEGAAANVEAIVRVQLEPEAVVIEGRRVPVERMTDPVMMAVREKSASVVHLQPRRGVSMQATVEALDALRRLDAEVLLRPDEAQP